MNVDVDFKEAFKNEGKRIMRVRFNKDKIFNDDIIDYLTDKKIYDVISDENGYYEVINDLGIYKAYLKDYFDIVEEEKKCLTCFWHADFTNDCHISSSACNSYSEWKPKKIKNIEEKRTCGNCGATTCIIDDYNNCIGWRPKEGQLSGTTEIVDEQKACEICKWFKIGWPCNIQCKTCVDGNNYEKIKYKELTNKTDCKDYNNCLNYKHEIKINKGIKFDKEKNRLDLLSFQAIDGLGKILTHGSIKYGDRNWEKGLSWMRCIGAILRHLFAFILGEDIDKDSGLPHIDHVMCNVMFLSHYQKTKTGNDDRIKNEGK